MELPVRVEELVHRVATRSSTKNQSLERKNRRIGHRTRQSKLEDSNCSSSDPILHLEPVPLKAIVEKRIERDWILEDINMEVRKEVEKAALRLDPPPRKVIFDDVPVIIELEAKLDEYDIIQDIKDQKANITIGQFLHKNANY